MNEREEDEEEVAKYEETNQKNSVWERERKRNNEAETRGQSRFFLRKRIIMAIRFYATLIVIFSLFLSRFSLSYLTHDDPYSNKQIRSRRGYK